MYTRFRRRRRPALPTVISTVTEYNPIRLCEQKRAGPEFFAEFFAGAQPAAAA